MPVFAETGFVIPLKGGRSNAFQCQSSFFCCAMSRTISSGCWKQSCVLAVCWGDGRWPCKKGAEETCTLRLVTNWNYPLYRVMKLGVLNSDAIKCPYWRAESRTWCPCLGCIDVRCEWIHQIGPTLARRRHGWQVKSCNRLSIYYIDNKTSKRLGIRSRDTHTQSTCRLLIFLYLFVSVCKESLRRLQSLSVQPAQAPHTSGKPLGSTSRGCWLCQASGNLE